MTKSQNAPAWIQKWPDSGTTRMVGGRPLEGAPGTWNLLATLGEPGVGGRHGFDLLDSG